MLSQSKLGSVREAANKIWPLMKKELLFWRDYILNAQRAQVKSPSKHVYFHALEFHLTPGLFIISSTLGNAQ